MDLITYWDGLTPDKKESYATDCGVTYNYLSQVANGHKKPSTDLAKLLHAKSKKKVVALNKLRPDVW